jgi:hypothetical protein
MTKQPYPMGVRLLWIVAGCLCISIHISAATPDRNRATTWSSAALQGIRDAKLGCRAVLKSGTNSVRCKFRVLKDRITISSCT